jgi:HPt (histidine-containing phosphotransfer) domain-containing protein
MTFTLTEMLAVLATIGLAVGVIAFVLLAKRLARTAAALEDTARRVNALMPTAQRLLASGESQLEELRTMTRTATQIVDHVHAVSGEASTATINVLRGLEDNVANRYGALLAGARAGLAVLKRVRGNGSNGGPDEAHDTIYAERIDGHE